MVRKNKFIYRAFEEFSMQSSFIHTTTSSNEISCSAAPPTRSRLLKERLAATLKQVAAPVTPDYETHKIHGDGTGFADFTRVIADSSDFQGGVTTPRTKLAKFAKSATKIRDIVSEQEGIELFGEFSSGNVEEDHLRDRTAETTRRRTPVGKPPSGFTRRTQVRAALNTQNSPIALRNILAAVLIGVMIGVSGATAAYSLHLRKQNQSSGESLDMIVKCDSETAHQVVPATPTMKVDTDTLRSLKIRNFAEESIFVAVANAVWL